MAERPCSIEECQRKDYWARGFCRFHYDRWLRHGDPELSKVAPCRPDCKCGRHSDNKHKPKVPSLPCLFCDTIIMVMPSRGPDGKSIQRFCNRDCYEEYRRQRIAERRAGGKSRIYDMSDDEFQNRLAAQGGRCAICFKGISGRHAYRDHCHASGEWRGLLCHGCNSGLGMFADDADVLLRAVDYLKNGGVVLDTTSSS